MAAVLGDAEALSNTRMDDSELNLRQDPNNQGLHGSEQLQTLPEEQDFAGHSQKAGTALMRQYQETGDLTDLEFALQKFREAVSLTPDATSGRAGHLQNLSDCFREKYRRLGDLNDLQAALQPGQEAVDLTPDGHPERAMRLRSLATCFRYRYERLGGDLADLNAALTRLQEAVDITPQGHSDRAEHLESLGSSFRERYQRLREKNDLDAALKADKEAAELTPGKTPDRARRLDIVGESLIDRYEEVGDLNDLEAALKSCQEAVDITPQGDSHEGIRVRNLAVCFISRYQKWGNLADLEAALDKLRSAVHSTPEGHPERPHNLQNLAACFSARYKRLRDLSDLQAALKADQEAVDLTPDGHGHMGWHLSSLAEGFTDRYHRLGDPDDLEAALRADQEAVDLTPAGHPGRARSLQGLAISLRDRYRRLGDVNDLNAALLSNEESVDLTPDEDPDRARRLQNLAFSLTEKYRKFHNPGDLDFIHNYYMASFETLTAAPEYSWDAALDWASFGEEFKLRDGITAYSKAFSLLPEILWIGHVLPLRHETIRRLDMSQVASAAARICIDFGNLTSAVEIMEQGLAIAFQQMLQLRTELDGLPSDEANKFQILSSELYSRTCSNPEAIAIEREALLKEIRSRPGFEYFLRPKSYSALCHASQGGPVVILNSHQDHCDAIVILGPSLDPVHVPLPHVTPELLESQWNILAELLGHCNVRARGDSDSSRLFGQRELFTSKKPEECFADLLAWLYTSVVAPVYEVLTLHNILKGRLWWLPTGAFTGLPLHACPPTNQFIHSYTATLGALLDGYAKKSSVPKVGVVGVTHTGQRSNYLPGVAAEVKSICSIIGKPLLECNKGLQATVDSVIQQLQDCSWMHLACHGKQDLNEPTKSELILYDGSLDLASILRMPLSNSQFVFLAACQTAMDNTQLLNQSFHLGGGFIAAGFRSAIGTMWAMNDKDGPLVAEVFYSHLFQNGRQPQASDTAEALQLAVEVLRARKVPCERWIPFIHMGV
ncbi:CHAT domain-containing protein [Mycena latifolia]|nr:CHAT domain-containing protein [Mycena latifolia]